MWTKFEGRISRYIKDDIELGRVVDMSRHYQGFVLKEYIGKFSSAMKAKKAVESELNETSDPPD